MRFGGRISRWIATGHAFVAFVLAGTPEGVAAFRRKDFAVAARELAGPAQQGDPEAQTYYGMLVAMGHAGPRDLERAASLFRSAVRQNYAPAMSQLGMMYVMGMGVGRNYSEARQWFERGMALGNKESITNLANVYEAGLGVPADPAKARELRQQAARMGEAVAQRQLQDARTPGADEFRRATTARSVRDFTRARALARESAAKGYVDGMTLAARLALLGEGGPKDHAEAMRYALVAARRGDAYAMLHVGYLYEFGLGVTANRTEALRYYDQATRLGERTAAQMAKNLRSPDYDPPARGGASGEGSLERSCRQAGGVPDGPFTCRGSGFRSNCGYEAGSGYVCR